MARAKRKRQQQMLVTGSTLVVATGVIAVILVLASNVGGERKEGDGLGEPPANAAQKTPGDNGDRQESRKTARLAADRPKAPTDAKEKHDAGPTDDRAAKTAGETPPAKPAEQEPPAEKDTEDDAKWTDASMSAAVVEQIPVQVLSVGWDKRKDDSADVPVLVITVEVKNPSRLPDNRVAFEGWSPDAPHRWVRMTDDRLRTWQPRAAEPANTVENMLPIKINPGKSARDVLIFDVANPKPKYLRLQLSGGALGKEGTANLKIPATMIEGTPPSPEPPKPAEKKPAARPAEKPRTPTGRNRNSTPADDFGIDPNAPPVQ